MATLDVTLPSMHEGQMEVAGDSARFKILDAGRRWRKSSLGVILCVESALRGGFAWWVSPSYPMSQVGWRMLKGLGMQIPRCEKKEVDKMLIMPGGGFVQVKSADKPDSLRGEGLNLAALDECALMREEAWTEALRPALSDKKGNALFLSTPKGRNWFWQLFLKGQDPAQDEWKSWQFPTASNPTIDPEEIEAARRSLPERVFLQEYMAEFIEDAGIVFRRVMDALLEKPRETPSTINGVVFGVDWGKIEDFTVITGIDTASREMMFMDRFNRIDYQFQVARLKAHYDKYKPMVIIAEQNSMGALIEILQRESLPVQPFVTTNATKAQAIEYLALAFERGEIKIINDQVLINELQAFEAKRLPSGLIRYQAPEGLHDDCVISLALAWQGVAGYMANGKVDMAPAVTGGQAW